MNLLKEICLSVSFALIGGGIINILSPVGWEKTVRYVTGLFIICCFAVPLAGADFSNLSDEFTLPSTNISEESYFDDERLFLHTEYELADTVFELLERETFSPYSVDVKLQTDEQEITSCTVTVRLSSQHILQRDAVYAIINKHFNGEAEIIVKEVCDDENA